MGPTGHVIPDYDLFYGTTYFLQTLLRHEFCLDWYPSVICYCEILFLYYCALFCKASTVLFNCIETVARFIFVHNEAKMVRWQNLPNVFLYHLFVYIMHCMIAHIPVHELRIPWYRTQWNLNVNAWKYNCETQIGHTNETTPVATNPKQFWTMLAYNL